MDSRAFHFARHQVASDTHHYFEAVTIKHRYRFTVKSTFDCDAFWPFIRSTFYLNIHFVSRQTRTNSIECEIIAFPVSCWRNLVSITSPYLSVYHKQIVSFVCLLTMHIREALLLFNVIFLQQDQNIIITKFVWCILKCLPVSMFSMHSFNLSSPSVSVTSLRRSFPPSSQSPFRC